MIKIVINSVLLVELTIPGLVVNLHAVVLVLPCYASKMPLKTIGSGDLNNYPRFEWNSGCTSTYTNWAGGQPDNGYGVEWYAPGQWNDASNEAAQRWWWAPSLATNLRVSVSE